MTETAAPLVPKPCPKCGAPGMLVKAGSRRLWVQCSRYPERGNCPAIGAQADNKKEAILNWNRLK